MEQPTTFPHVLVIDDDWMNREVIEAFLQTENFRVTTAANAQKGIRALQSAPDLDLILLDAMLPDQSGFDLCHQLKSLSPFVPIVMVTALESDADKNRAIQAGADDFISKPFSYPLMLTRVKSLVQMKRLRDELAEKNKLLERILNRYVDEDLVQILLGDPERHLQLGGDTRRVTVVFVDISGFTAFAEQHSAQTVVGALNQLFGVLTDLVAKHQGTFDKYIGDEIMAFFGAPLASDHDTLNAVLMALEMQAEFTRMIQQMGDDFRALGLAIGLHTGEVVVGNVGSERFMNYTVIGDVVNTAHRLQEQARAGQILISEVSYQEVQPYIQARRLEPTLLPGKREPIVIYEVTGQKA